MEQKQSVVVVVVAIVAILVVIVIIIIVVVVVCCCQVACCLLLLFLPTPANCQTNRARRIRDDPVVAASVVVVVVAAIVLVVGRVLLQTKSKTLALPSEQANKKQGKRDNFSQANSQTNRGAKRIAKAIIETAKPIAKQIMETATTETDQQTNRNGATATSIPNAEAFPPAALRGLVLLLILLFGRENNTKGKIS